MAAGPDMAPRFASRLGWFTYPLFPGLDASATIETVAAMGYRSIEITEDLLADPASLPRAAGRAEELGLRVAAIGALRDLVTGERAERDGTCDALLAIIRAAGAAHVPVVTIYAGPDTWNPQAPRVGRDIASADARERAFGTIDRLLPQAEAAGVRLGFKPVLGSAASDLASTMPFIERYDGSPAFGLTLDPSHFVVHGDDIGEVIRAFAPYLANVHLKDAFGGYGEEGVDFHFPPIGTGATDWTTFFAALAEAGYDGSLHVLAESEPFLRNLCGGSPVLAASRLRAATLALLEATSTDR